MNKATKVCPSCKSKKISKKGKLFDSNVFSGVNLGYRLNGGELYECETCYLAFRDPIVEQEKIERLYQQGLSSLYHSEIRNRSDWQLATQWIEANVVENSKILDIGCFDGAFLESIAGGYQKFGIEIHPEALKRAEAKGIEIICKNVFDLNNCDQEFDCITLIDVIEHLPNPSSVFDLCLSKIRPKGSLIVTTGNYNSWQFQLMSPNYWYCNIEHISFIGEKWVLSYLENKEISNLVISKFSHRRGSKFAVYADIVKNMMYKLSPNLYENIKLLRKYLTKQETSPHAPPDWKTAKDHFAIVIQK